MKILIVGASGTWARLSPPSSARVTISCVPAVLAATCAWTCATRPVSPPCTATSANSTPSCARRARCLSHPWRTWSEAKYLEGLQDKLLGQVRLVEAGTPTLRDGGSFTLITGILAEQPIVAGACASMVNGAVEAFVRAAAIELPRGIRINVVSPNVLTEAMDSYAPFFRGFEPVSAARAALAFSRSVEGRQTGQVYKIW